MKKLCKRIITFSLVLCMALSVFTGVVYAADTDTIVILYENDVHCAVEGYSKLAAKTIAGFYLNLQKITLKLLALIAPRKETQIHIEVRQI